MTDRLQAVERELLADPAASNRHIAALTGASHTFVGRTRRTMERTGRLVSPAKRRMADGRMRTVASAEVEPTYAGGLVSRVREIWGIRE